MVKKMKRKMKRKIKGKNFTTSGINRTKTDSRKVAKGVRRFENKQARVINIKKGKTRDVGSKRFNVFVGPKLKKRKG